MRADQLSIDPFHIHTDLTTDRNRAGHQPRSVGKVEPQVGYSGRPLGQMRATEFIDLKAPVVRTDAGVRREHRLCQDAPDHEQRCVLEVDEAGSTPCLVVGQQRAVSIKTIDDFRAIGRRGPDQNPVATRIDGHLRSRRRRRERLM